MRRPIYLILILIMCTLVLFTSCRKQSRLVGVSQCAEGVWRQQMIAEMKRAALLHEGVSMKVLTSHDNAKQQAQQIEQLIEMGVDVLIVSPTNSTDLCDVLEKAHAKDIPVVLVDRKSVAGHYEAFIGGDNIQVGAMAARYVRQLVDGMPQKANLRIIEIEGDVNMTPVQERHGGFVVTLDSLGLNSETYICNWQRDQCQALTDSLLRSSSDQFIIFCHNDGMALDVYHMAEELGMQHRVHLVGVDALCGDGVDMIDRGQMEASMRYPTGGEEAMTIALDLLEGHSPKMRDNLIPPFVVNKANANVVRMEDEKIMSISQDNEQMGDLLIGERRKLSNVLPALMFSVILSLVLCLLLVYLYHAYRRTERRHKEAEHQLEEYLKATAKSDLNIGGIAPAPADTSDFMSRLSQCLTVQLANADATVDDLANQMNMSRSQFYNRVKDKTGYTPMEILRIARLKQATLLLQNPEHTVQEVCYLVGFATPSYFAKCFKKYHGVSPSEYQMMQIKK